MATAPLGDVVAVEDGPGPMPADRHCDALRRSGMDQVSPRNRDTVCVGISHDTPAVAAHSIATW